jgi:hypothetical protein
MRFVQLFSTRRQRASQIQMLRRLRLEPLESRHLLAADWVWTGNGNGRDYIETANWTVPALETDRFPGETNAAATVTIDIDATVDLGSNPSVDSLNINANTQIYPDGTIALLTAGQINVGSQSIWSTLELNNADVSVKKSLNVIDGQLQINGHTTLSVYQTAADIVVGGGGGPGTINVDNSVFTVGRRAGNPPDVTIPKTTIGGMNSGMLSVANDSAARFGDLYIGTAAKGQVLVSDESRLRAKNVFVSGGTNASTDTVLQVQANSKIFIANQLSVAPYGQVYILDGSTIEMNGILDENHLNSVNRGLIHINRGGTLDHFGDFINRGTLSGPEPDFPLDLKARLPNTNVKNEGSGYVRGRLDIQSFQNDARASPADSSSLGPASAITVDDAFVQSSTGSLEIRLLGAGQGAAGQSDQLVVGGDADLSGNLVVTAPLGTSEYTAGSYFDVLTAHSMSGEFTNLPAGTYDEAESGGILPSLNDPDLEWKVTYGDMNQDGEYEVRLQVVPKVFINPGYFDGYSHVGYFKAYLSTTSTADVTGSYAYTDGTAVSGTDYESNTGKFTIPAGLNFVYLPVQIDSASKFHDNDNDFTVSLNDSNDDPLASAKGYIRTIQFTMTPTMTTVSESVGSVTLEVTPSKLPFESDISFDYADREFSAKRNADYRSPDGTNSPIAGTLTWHATTNPNQAATPKEFDIQIVDDSIPEDQEHFYVDFTNPHYATGNLVFLDPASALDPTTALATINIDDDDQDPYVYIASTATVVEGSTTPLDVWLSGASGKPVSVRVSTRDGSATAGLDYDALASVLVAFAPGETHKTVDVSALTDDVDDFDENFYADLADAWNATAAPQQSSSTITITNVHQNRPPTAINDAYTMYRNGTLTIPAPGVLGNDTDPENDPLTAAIASPPNSGSVTLNANGSFTYTPTPGFVGIDTFTYWANDGQYYSNAATVTIGVQNRAPTANNTAPSTYEAVHGQPLFVSAASVMANVTDPDGDPLLAVLVQGPAHGTLTWNGDGSFSYAVNPGYSGPDSFTFQGDDGVTKSDVITISVNFANQSPVALDQSAATGANSTILIPLVANYNYSDQDGDALSVSLSSYPSNGTAYVSAGGVVYSPNPAFTGNDSFNYTIDDGHGGTATATVSITVNNQAPVAVSDHPATTRNAAVVVPVLANDYDPDQQQVQLASVGAPSYGTAVANPDGTVTYTPNPGFAGTDSFTYVINDGHGLTGAGTVTIDVQDRAPSAANDAYTVLHGRLLTVPAAGVLSNDTDPDGDPLSAALVQPPAHGTLTWNGDGSFGYTSDLSFTGYDSFTYAANDGVAQSYPATVTIFVTNTAPTVASRSYSMSHNGTLSVIAPGVLTDDADAEGDALTAVVVSQPAHGTLNLYPDGSFTYVPAFNYAGADSFTFKANDGAWDSNISTITLNITNSNPIAQNDYATTLSNTPVNVRVLDNDMDPDGDILGVLGTDHGNAVVNPDNTVTYIPATGYTGTDSFTYFVGDSVGGIAMATVIVDVLNQAPVTTDDSATTHQGKSVNIAVLSNDSDPEMQQLHLSSLGTPSFGYLAANPDGTVTYTPNPGFVGTDSFPYVIDDGHGSTAAGIVTVQVTNTAPNVVDRSYSIAHNSTLYVGDTGVLAGASDADGDALTAAVVSLPLHGTVSLNSNGWFYYVPDHNYIGSDSFTFKANDGATDSNIATVTIVMTNANPIAQNDYATTASNTAVSVAVLGNDMDPDGDILGVLSAENSNGIAVLNSDGTITFTPATAFTGTSSFIYIVTDSLGGTAAATVVVTVTNQAPVAVNDSATTIHDRPVVIPVLSNDSDPDLQQVQLDWLTSPSRGTVVNNGDGTVTYTPWAGYLGGDSFSYSIDDGHGLTATGTVNVQVTDNAPNVVDGSYTVAHNAILSVIDAGVLTGASDADNDALAAAVVSGPAHGIVSMNANGSFVYQPNLSYFGPDSFTFQANDGAAGSNLGTITLNVTDNAPTIVDRSYSIAHNSTLYVGDTGVLVGASDADGDALTAAVVSLPLHGTVSLNSNGWFYYVPDHNYVGPDSFTFKANDGASDSSSVATISLYMTNANPIAQNDYATTASNTAVSVAVLGNDMDPDGDILGVLTTDHGNAIVNSDGTITYIPATAFTGTDSFIYIVTDSLGGTAEATVFVTVTNQAPMAVTDTATTHQGQSVNIAVLSNDSDPDLQQVQLEALGAPSFGSVFANSDGTVVYTPNAGFAGSDSFVYVINDGHGLTTAGAVTVQVTNIAPTVVDRSYSIGHNGTLSVNSTLKVTDRDLLYDASDADNDLLTAAVVSGPAHGIVSINANGSFTYVPNRAYVGDDSFTFKANDGAADSNIGTITIAVTNAIPVAQNDYATTLVDTAVVIPVLDNDSDPDSDVLTVQSTNNGSVTVNSDGTVTYSPNQGFTGVDIFSYVVSDGHGGTATASVVITVTNQAPVAAADAAMTHQGQSVNISVLANDSDPDLQQVQLASIGAPSYGTAVANPDGTITYRPNAGFAGIDSFIYTINDGHGMTAAGTVTVQVTNIAPGVVNGSFSMGHNGTLSVAAGSGVLYGAGDADGDSLSAAVVTGPSHGTLTVNQDGSFNYAPTLNYVGSDSFTFKANDGATDSNIATVTIVMTNAPPIAGNDFVSTASNTAVNVRVLDNDSDPDGDILGVLSANGTVIVNSDNTVTYIPPTGFTGTDSFTYIIGDGVGGTATATVFITVTNQAPVAVTDTATTHQGQSVNIAVLANDSDPDLQQVQLELLGTAGYGSVVANSDGTVVYTPNAGFVGSDSFGYIINDGHGMTATGIVNVTVTNSAPTVVGGSYSIGHNGTLSVAAGSGVLYGAGDADGDSLSAAVVAGPSHGTLTLNANGSFTYVPDRTYVGADSFTFKANDGAADSNIATISLDVTNADPLAGNDYATTSFNTAVVIDVLSNDSDPDGDILTVQPTVNGRVTVNSDCTLTYTPNPGFTGTDSFGYIVSDGHGGTATATVVVVVPNLTPTAVSDSASTRPGTPVTVDVLANDYDPEGQTLTVESVGAASHGSVALNQDGTLTYTSEAGFTGTDSFSYTINDGYGGITTGTVTISIHNEAPTAANQSASTPVDTPIAFNLLSTAADPDGDTLGVLSVGTPANGTVSVDPYGVATYTPNSGFVGDDSFTYTVTDPYGATAAATVFVSVLDA